MEDPRQSPSLHLTTRFANAKVPGVTNFEQNCLFYVKQLQERWWNADHQRFSGTPEEKCSAIAAYEGFNEILQRLLQVQLDRNVDSEPTLFGNQISDANLSDGQKVILQICVALHAQKADFDNTIFILDEPENHLHPSAVIELLDSLYRSTDRSQIWIATHSIPLLAYVASIEPMSLWFVEDGLVKNSGRAPQKVLEGLLGSEERIGQLNAFTGLPAQLASIQYACESLLAPQVVSAGGRDPQVNQIQIIISKLCDSAPVRVLDYGAGKGRLLEGLAEGFAAASQELPMLINYFAFDQFPVDRSICESVIRSHFPESVKRYFGSNEEFLKTKRMKAST
ncbi:MAG: ATP-binding protein [Betaproteobacteria bacterium]|nr:ATP-binding protein [Betaproteobacteria bacterium]